ncbi:MAG: exo-alpha-sialidase [Lentimicrobium sp.]|nr:exo-alpha-sialidase [Lentimicrobium sp.]
MLTTKRFFALINLSVLMSIPFLLMGQVQIFPSLVSDDHTAEGFMITLPDGSLRHFFRLDPGENGHHIGNNSRIVQRASSDQGFTWTALHSVYEDEWDNRNVHGGVTEEGRIVLFFRRYNAINRKTISTNFIYSIDYGDTWSDIQTIATGPADNPGTHKMIHIPGKGYMQSFYTPWLCELRYSDDGTNWDKVGFRWDFNERREIKISEACFLNLGEGKLIGLMRDEWLSNYYQVMSADSGTTWTEPVRTNISMPFFTPSPQLFYDFFTNRIFVIANDRRGLSGGNYVMNDAEFYIYMNDPDEAFNNPKSYVLAARFNRPFPNSHHFYGYPTYSKLDEGRYLIMFTESYKKENDKEQADFYQFELLTNSYMPLADQAIVKRTGPRLRIFPNPIDQVFTAELSQLVLGDRVTMEIYNNSGQLVWQNEEVGFDGFKLDVDVSDYPSGVYYLKVISNNMSATETIVIQ